MRVVAAGVFVLTLTAGCGSALLTTVTVHNESMTNSFVVRTETTEGYVDILLTPSDTALVYRRSTSEWRQLSVLSAATCDVVDRVDALRGAHVFVVVEENGDVHQEPWEDPGGSPHLSSTDVCVGR